MTAGSRAIEAYPSRGSDGSAQSNHRGTLDIYVRAGFEPYRELEWNAVMRKSLLA